MSTYSAGWAGDVGGHKVDAELQLCPVGQPPRGSRGRQLPVRQVERRSHSGEDHARVHSGRQNLQKGVLRIKDSDQMLQPSHLMCVCVCVCEWQLARTYSYAHSWMHKGWNCGDFFDEGITNGASWYSLSKGERRLRLLGSLKRQSSRHLNNHKKPPLQSWKARYYLLSRRFELLARRAFPASSWTPSPWPPLAFDLLDLLHADSCTSADPRWSCL